MTHATKSLLTIPRIAAAACLLALAGPASAQHAVEVGHKTVKVGGLDIFYREAGPEGASSTVLLLHGFPTSSQMFRMLIPALGDTYHVVAPDYSRLRPQLHAPEGQVRLHLRQLGESDRRVH